MYELYRLYNAGWLHGDPHWENALVLQNNDIRYYGRTRVLIIDFGRSRRRRQGETLNYISWTPHEPVQPSDWRNNPPVNRGFWSYKPLRYLLYDYLGHPDSLQHILQWRDTYKTRLNKLYSSVGGLFTALQYYQLLPVLPREPVANYDFTPGGLILAAHDGGITTETAAVLQRKVILTKYISKVYPGVDTTNKPELLTLSIAGFTHVLHPDVDRLADMRCVPIKNPNAGNREEYYTIKI